MKDKVNIFLRNLSSSASISLRKKGEENFIKHFNLRGRESMLSVGDNTDDNTNININNDNGNDNNNNNNVHNNGNNNNNNNDNNDIDDSRNGNNDNDDKNGSNDDTCDSNNNVDHSINNNDNNHLSSSSDKNYQINNKADKSKKSQNKPNMTFKVTNKRCLLLDGALCNSVKTFSNCTTHTRTREDIIVPNYCSSTYAKILSVQLCTPYLGSLRAYLDNYCLHDKKNNLEKVDNKIDSKVEIEFDNTKMTGKSKIEKDCKSDEKSNSGGNTVDESHNNKTDYCNNINNDTNNKNDNVKKEMNDTNNTKNDLDTNLTENSNANQFGLIYLDYCCRLSAGYKNIEKCPISDIQCLFEYGVFDSGGINTLRNTENAENGNLVGGSKIEKKTEKYVNSRNEKISSENHGNIIPVSILAICLCNEEEETENENGNENENISKSIHSSSELNYSSSKKRKLPPLSIGQKNMNQNPEKKNIENLHDDNGNLKKIMFDAAAKYGYQVEAHGTRY
jgi:hypothetical protein